MPRTSLCVFSHVYSNQSKFSFSVTRPGTNECLVLRYGMGGSGPKSVKLTPRIIFSPASQWCETEVLERIFIQWGIGMGNIAADYEDLTVRPFETISAN